jgi:hypothetical protein
MRYFYLFIFLIASCGVKMPNPESRVTFISEKTSSNRSDDEQLADAMMAGLVDFQTVKPLFNENCVSCHNSTRSVGGFDFSKYPSNAVSLTDATEIYFGAAKGAVTVSRMPPQPLDSDTRFVFATLLKIFVENKAKENISNAIRIDEKNMLSEIKKLSAAIKIYEERKRNLGGSKIVNFDDHVRPLMQDYCLGCHTASPRWNLSSYEAASYEADKNTEKKWTTVVKLVASDYMPPKSQDTAVLKQTLRAWQEAGFPQSAQSARLTLTNPSIIENFICEDPKKLPVAYVNRLTTYQYLSMLRKGVGNDDMVNSSAKGLIQDNFANGAPNIGAMVSRDKLESYVDVALNLSRKIVNDKPTLYRLFPCLNTTDANAVFNCVNTNMVMQFAQTIWRRPVREPERAKFEAMYHEGISKNVGNDVIYVTILSSIFASPNTFMHSESALAGGRIDANQRKLLLSKWDLANKISILISDSRASTTLVTRSDEYLTTGSSATIETELNGLLNSNWTIFYGRFARAWLKLDSMPLPQIEGLDPAQSLALKSAMTDEIRYTVAYVFHNEQTFEDLFKTRATNVSNLKLKEIYGASVEPGPALTTIPDSRPGGILLRAGLLTTDSISGKIVPRGAKFYSILFGRSLVAPAITDPNILKLMDDAELKKATHSSRWFYDTVTKAAASCAACHNVINPAGYALQQYDGSGKFRGDGETKSGVYMPYDLASKMFFRDGTTTLVNGPTEYSNAAASSQEVRILFVKTLYEYLTGKTSDRLNACLQQKMLHMIEEKRPLKELVRTVFLSEEFRTKAY